MTPTAPGAITKELAPTAVASPPTDVSTEFVAGLAKRGPAGVAVPRGSVEEFTPIFGGEVSYGYLFDDCRWTNAEEGADGFYSRVVGPAAKQASAKLVDGTAANTLEVLAGNVRGAFDPGEWANGLKVKIVLAEGKLTIEVLEGATVLESFGKDEKGPITRAEAIAQTNFSAYFRLKDLGGGDPKTQEVTLSGGTDDRASIVIANWEAASAAFKKELGPGQLKWPGQTTKAARVAMMEHCSANNRMAVPDAVDTRTKATHLAAAAEWATISASLRDNSFLPFGPWLPVPVAEGLEKVLPPSILVGAVIARHDAETYDPVRKITNPNAPAAGKDGIIKSALGVSQEAWTDAERGELKLAINVIRVVYREVRIYGYRTMSDPVKDPTHALANNCRLDMALKAKGQIVAEETMFGEIDGKGHKLGELEGALKGVYEPYREIGALYDLPGQPGSAYSIDVGEDVNPIAQLFEGKARALAKPRRAPFAESVEIDYQVEGAA